MTVVNPKSISGINSITTGSGSDDLLTIHNNSGAERFRIDGSGNTRITSGIVTTVSVGAVTGDISIDDKIIHTGDTNTAIRFPVNDNVSVETSGIEAFRVDSGRRLLIGTTASRSANSAQGSFQIEGTGAEDSDMSIIRNQANSGGPAIVLGKSRHASLAGNTVVQDDDQLGALVFVGNDGTDLTSQGARIDAYIDGTPGSNDMPCRITFSTTADGASSSTERLRINSVGKVGINSTAPDGMLAIEHTSSAPNLTMRNHPAAGPYTNEYGMELRHAYGSVKHGALIHTEEAADARRSLDVSDSNGVFATFTNGKVGVGTITPTEKLEVHNSAGTTLIKASVNGNSRVGLEIQKTGATTQTWRIQDGQTANGILEFYDQTDSRSVMTLDGSGNVTVGAGNLIMGTAGKGIDFSAQTQSTSTTDDEILDHYEKGKWTPVIKKNGGDNAHGSNGGTPTVIHGRYIRTGKSVWLSMYVRWNSGSNSEGASGGWTIEGLPFSLQDDNPGTCRIYQYAPAGYFIIDDTDYAYADNPRWQINTHTYFDLYTDTSSADLAWTTGMFATSFTGTFMLHE